METDRMAGAIVDLLAPLLSRLLSNKTDKGRAQGQLTGSVRSVWAILAEEMARNRRLRDSAEDLALSPQDHDIRVIFELQVKRFLSNNPSASKTVKKSLVQVGLSGGPSQSAPIGLFQYLPQADETISRLRIIALLRAGKSADEVAQQFGMDRKTVFRLSALLAGCGVAGLLSGKDVESWLDRLDKSDPILRRLEMLRLLRSGVPLTAVMDEYGAVEEYVERIEKKFSSHGLMGLLTEDEIGKLLSYNPKTIRVCTYNLHGNHDDDPFRYRLIARGLSDVDPHLAAFQEVLSGEGIEDTSDRIAKWTSAITGYHYQSNFLYCHRYMEKYPEGVAVATRCPVKGTRAIDLTRLGAGLSPSMERHALVTEVEIYGRRVILASVHLDHHADERVRLAQARKLAVELHPEKQSPYCAILAGDFNAEEDSSALDHLREMGYKDAFRACHKGGGNTFPVTEPKSRIDYILVKGDVEIVSAGLLLSEQNLSDHLGVYAEIR